MLKVMRPANALALFFDDMSTLLAGLRGGATPATCLEELDHSAAEGEPRPHGAHALQKATPRPLFQELLELFEPGVLGILF